MGRGVVNSQSESHNEEGSEGWNTWEHTGGDFVQPGGAGKGFVVIPDISQSRLGDMLVRKVESLSNEDRGSQSKGSKARKSR